MSNTPTITKLLILVLGGCISITAGSVVALLGPLQSVVKKTDIKDYITKTEIIALMPDDSEYTKDQRLILSHMRQTEQSLSSIEKQIAEIQRDITRLKVLIDPTTSHG